MTVAFFDTTLLDPSSRGFSGAVSDGRYIYFVPMANYPSQFFGQVTRYDTHGDFSDPDSWALFDSSALNKNSRGFADGLFDGRYLYLIPYYNQRHHGQVTRYDTQGDFHNPEAWSFFDIQTRIDSGRGFVSGTFDGRYIYLAPYQLDWTAYNGTMVRYDTQQPFKDLTSWETFVSHEQLALLSRGFHSAAVTDDFIYFVPFVREQRDYHGLLVRYRRSGAFSDPRCWDMVDIKTFHPRGCGFIGACWDGRYLYFAPYFDGAGRYGQVACYDTQSPLTDPNSWQFFDTTIVHDSSRGFFGTLVHGDFVYFVPHCRGEGVYHGQLTRYDRRLPFTEKAAWSVCDTAAYHPTSKGYIGGTVVGDYLYLAPYEIAPGMQTGLVARIDLRDQTLWPSS